MTDTHNGEIVAKTLADRTYLQIRRDIVNGALAPDTKLRLEALAERYGVGMSPLREALARLVGDNLVVNVGQRGFWVASLSLEQFEDITRVRTLIETEALQRSIEQGDAAWEAEVQASFEALSRLEDHLPTGGEEVEVPWEEANRRFHTALIAACGSPWLIRLRNMLDQQSERYRHISLAQKEGNRCVHEEHVAITDAVLQRNVLRACRLTEQHLARTADRVRAALAQVKPST